MATKLQKVIEWSFYSLFFVIPLFFYPVTSELFEFNKMTLTYLIAVIIFFTWSLKAVISKKLTLKKTVLDLPLTIFLISQILATIFSIDVHTSLIGFYSRFHGGLYSTIAYIFLYFAFINNLQKRQAQKALSVLLFSGLLVSIYGILQHFGIDSQLWQQDVKERVFSTLGQPNWLGAFLIFLIPITQVRVLKAKAVKTKSFIYNYLLFIAFIITLLFTKSRSSLLGFGISQIILWGFFVGSVSKRIKHAILIFVGLGLIVMLIGTPWTKNISKLLVQQTDTANSRVQEFIPALERGGTDSTQIRKIVWKGAIAIWRRYPIFGSGVETFGYAYYKDRPVEHNGVSEWDFLYNKAHNEYLNFAATTGTLGLLSYLYLCFSIVFMYFKFAHKKKNSLSLEAAALSGFLAILVSNIFGFSVVVTGILFFVFPGVIIATNTKEATVYHKSKNEINMDASQALFGMGIIFVSIFMFYLIIKLWIADINYSLGKSYNSQEQYPQAREKLLKAVNLYGTQPEYYSELAKSAAGITLLFDSSKNTEAIKFAQLADLESQKSVDLSPSNVNLLRTRAITLLTTALINSQDLDKARIALEKAIELAPTDAKLYYNLGLVYARENNTDKAKEIFTKTIELKPDYRNARFALGLILKSEGDTAGAKTQFENILSFLDTSDSLVKNELDSLK